jgi:hypothetical protein
MRVFALIISLTVSTVIVSASSKRRLDDHNDPHYSASKHSKTGAMGNAMDVDDSPFEAANDLLKLSADGVGSGSGWEMMSLCMPAPDLEEGSPLRLVAIPSLAPANADLNVVRSAGKTMQQVGDLRYRLRSQSNNADQEAVNTNKRSHDSGDEYEEDEDEYSSVRDEDESEQKSDANNPDDKLEILHKWMVSNPQKIMTADLIVEILHIRKRTAWNYLRIIGLNPDLNRRLKNATVISVMNSNILNKTRSLKRILNIGEKEAWAIKRRFDYIKKYGPEILCSGNAENEPNDEQNSSAPAPNRSRTKLPETITDFANDPRVREIMQNDNPDKMPQLTKTLGMRVTKAGQVLRMYNSLNQNDPEKPASGKKRKKKKK